MQRAAMLAQEGRAAEALDAVKESLSFFRANRYRLYELFAMHITARAHEELGQYTEARTVADQSLAMATQLNDEYHLGLALENLGGQSNALGNLPEALGFRARGLAIHRRQKDVATLGFDLVNNADLLVRLGRHAEASRLVAEVDQGAAAGIDAYKQRARRAALMPVLSAAILHRGDDVVRLSKLVPPPASGKPDSTQNLATAAVRYAAPRAPGAAPEASLGSLTSPIGRELRYWDLMARLSHSPPADVLTRVTEVLADKNAAVSYEFGWRIGAIGAAAARAVKDNEREGTFRTDAQRALERLRKEWKSDVASYESRPDLTELRRKAGLK